MKNFTPEEQKCQEILEEAIRKIRRAGYAPRFKWGTNPQGKPNYIAACIGDFEGFHPLPESERLHD